MDFIGIGAQKAGTTWLYDRLHEIDGICVTPIKELHYFDRDTSYISPNYFAISKLLGRMLLFRWYKRLIKDVVRELVRNKSIRNAIWMIKWHFGNYSDEFLKDFVSNWEVDGIKGEITPSYSLLHEADIKRIKVLFPKVKIILILRDPIKRAWSHCRYRQPTVLGSNESIKRFIDSPEQSQRGDYLDALRKYKEVFSSENIFVCFYDSILEDPEGLIKKLSHFLGVSNVKVEQLGLHQKSNVSESKKIDQEIYTYLLMKYKPMIKKLSDVYGGYFSKWYNDHYTKNKNWIKTNYFHP